MSDKCISAKHIEKLSHHIPEIRERALLNIHSKLQRGILYDNDLARCKELFWQLCNWFRENKPPMRHEEIVIKMLKCIIKSDTGIHLIDLHGPKELMKEFSEIQKIVDRVNQCHFMEINKYIEDLGNVNGNPIVPPLNLGELNSNRSGAHNSPSLNISGKQTSKKRQETVGSTATTIAGFVDSFVSLDVGDNNLHTNTAKDTPRFDKKVTENPFRHYTFLWQWLIGADRHVLESVENTLRNPSDPRELLNALEFISCVLLSDFPAEIFLQRPAIIKQLHDLLWSSPSSRIATAILKCLEKLTKQFMNRILYYNNPGTHNLKLNNFHVDSPSNTARDLDDSSSTEIETMLETENLMKSQMNLPQYCLNTMNAIFDYLYIMPEAGDSFRRKKCNKGINTALIILHDSIKLLKLAVKRIVFEVDLQLFEIVEVILKKFEETLRKYGEVLSHFRIKVLSEDFKEETRLIQLHLLKNFQLLHSNFIPFDREDLLPANLKHALSETILDAPLSRLFPVLHYNLKDLVKDFQSDEVYTELTHVCTSMTASLKFLRDWKALPFTKNISLVKESLYSLEFHKNFNVISIFIDLAANKLTTHTFDEDILETIEYIVLTLLSHPVLEIKLAAYKNCYSKVIKTIGAKLNVTKSSAPGSQILFLLRGKILALVAIQGLNDTSEEVQNMCEDILVHVLKAKLLVSEEIWQETVTALMPSMPILLTHTTEKKSLIGRNVLTLLDPDRCLMMNFSAVEIIRLNVGLLFVRNSDVRMEAASRVSWILNACPPQIFAISGSGDSRREIQMLPHINNLHDKALAEVCQMEKKLDLQTLARGQTHFYQPSSLHQVFDLLTSANTDPVIRRSAITQVSVMMEDPLLHSIFLERGGLDVITKSMLSALNDVDYQSYPDSTIPCLGILKNLCLYNTTIRHIIGNSEVLLHLIMRGIFMFCTEPRVKQDGAILLFFVVFNEHIRGSLVKNDISVADILQNTLKSPIAAKRYCYVDTYALKSLKELRENKWALSSLQIHWNIEYFQGLDALLQPKVKYTFENKADAFSDLLRLSPTDLNAVKSSSLPFTIKECLETIYQSHCHDEIIANLYLLTRCINLYEITKENICFDIGAFKWEQTFSRYLTAPPAGQEDNILLSTILDFFALIFPHMKVVNNNATWIISLLTSRTHFFNVLLSSEIVKEQEENAEKLLNSLLNLINVCVVTEQSTFNLESLAIADKRSPFSLHNTVLSPSATFDPPDKYSHIVKILIKNIRSSPSRHFYNLAYLDRMLTTLTLLTSSSGWSNCKQGEGTMKVMTSLTTYLFELLNAFQSGKQPSASDSLMGLNITRNVMYVLNHLVAEMQRFNIKDWEECFDAVDAEVESVYKSIFVLRNSRDVLLRAGALHLLAGLAMSKSCAVQMIQDIADKKDYLYLWKIVLGILCDHEESSIIRENAALLLTNLSSHAEPNGAELLLAQGLLMKCTVQSCSEILHDPQKKVLLTLLESNNFFDNVEIILNRLTTSKVFNFYELRGATNSDMNDFMFVYNKVLEVSVFSDSLNPNNPIKPTQKFEDIFAITTPGVINGLSTFIYNLMCIFPQTVCKELHSRGLVKQIFSCVTLPNIEVETTSDLIYYTDVLQMNSSVCLLLAKACESNENCLLTVGNARNCLSVMTHLLDPAIYIIVLPELHYLRNKLWTNLFNLLNTLLQGSQIHFKEKNEGNHNQFDTDSVILELDSQKESFLLSVCESISSDINISSDLQLSALHSLTSLLNLNPNKPSAATALSVITEENEDQSEENFIQTQKHSSVQVLLDSTRTPRINSSYNMIGQLSSKVDLLKEIYFGTVTSREQSSLSTPCEQSVDDNSKEVRMAGAEICKILLNIHENLNLQQSSNTTLGKPAKQSTIKRKSIIISTLTGLLFVSNEAKHYALTHGLVMKIMSQLQSIYVQLSLENVDSFRKISEKKRLLPIILELEGLLCLTMNFLYGNEDVKIEAAQLGLTDLLHKIWHWFSVQKSLLITALKLLCTFTTNCTAAASSLTLTSSAPGSAPRKSPGNTSLLHVICSMVIKEMEMISRTRNLATLELCFHLLHNAVSVSECRFILVKRNFLAAVSKLHPALTKRQKPWEQVEMLWLEFLAEFSAHSEGQIAIGKMNDVTDIVLTLCGCPKGATRVEALKVLRNIAFHQGNRSRLLASGDFLNILTSRLSSSIAEEISIVVPTIWALAANCQKAKMIFRGVGVDKKIKDYLRVLYLNNYANVNEDEVKALRYVLKILTTTS